MKICRRVLTTTQNCKTCHFTSWKELNGLRDVKEWNCAFFFNFEIYKLLSPLSSWPPKLLVDIKELKHARCWDTDGNRKWAVFPFNLSSHNHIYIAKYLFFVCRPRLKNALAYNSIGFARTYPMNSDSSAAWIAPSNLWTTRGWWKSPLLWVADNLCFLPKR